MAKDYVDSYRQLLKKSTSGTKPRRVELNGGNDLTPVWSEKQLPALFEAGADPKIQI
jgi:hypothetical protein